MESTLIFYVFKNFYRTAIKIFDTSHYQQFTPPFDLPDSWEWVRLGDISEIKGGTTIPTEQECSEGILPYIKVSDLNTQENIKEITTSNRYVNEWKESHVISKDSIVFPKRGGAIFTNKKRITRQPLLADLNLMSVHPLGCFEYVYLWFDSFKLSTIQSGSNIPQINNQDLEPLYIPLPPEKEQTRIVCTVSKLLDIIDILSIRCSNLFDKINIAKSKILELAMQGKLVPQDSADEPAADMLCRINPKAKIITDTPHSWNIPQSWGWVKLGDIFNHNTGKALNSTNKDGIEYEYITTSNVYWDRFELSGLKKMFFKDSEIEKCMVKHGDLLVCEGGDIGRCAIWNFDKDIMIQNHLHRLRPLANEINPQLYCRLFKLYKEKGLVGGKGIALQGFSSNALHNLVVPLMAENEQKRIVAKIEELYACLDKIEASLQS